MNPYRNMSSMILEKLHMVLVYVMNVSADECVEKSLWHMGMSHNTGGFDMNTQG